MCNQKEIAFVGFEEDTILSLVEVSKGDPIVCPRCEGIHYLCCGKDSNGDECCLLMYYKCGGGLYLGAINERLIVGIKPDSSGTLPKEVQSDKNISKSRRVRG